VSYFQLTGEARRGVFALRPYHNLRLVGPAKRGALRKLHRDAAEPLHFLVSVPAARGLIPAPARTRRRARTGESTGTRRRGRPRGSGTRSKQALELVQARPGITIPEIAEAIGIQQNYLYRVLPALQKDGLARKEGRGWHPRQAA
jgi:winged helix-turn-helix DNA-binding protein